MNHHWYEDSDGMPKTHRRPRTCKDCQDNPKGACLLPFRKARPVRKFSAMDKKPMLRPYPEWVRRIFGK